MEGRSNRREVISIATGLCVILLLSTLTGGPDAGPRADPALMSSDPGSFRGDEWDVRAAEVLERSRQVQLMKLLAHGANDLDVVSRVFLSRPRSGVSERIGGDYAASAEEVLIVRRLRAAYLVSLRAIRDSAPDARLWGLEVVRFLEWRRRAFAIQRAVERSSERAARELAMAAVGRLFVSDPDIDVRLRSGELFLGMASAHGKPTTGELVSALQHEPSQKVRRLMLWSIAERDTPPETLLSAALVGFDRPETLAHAFRNVFKADNKALIESAYRDGDVVCRSAIGATFHRRREPAPWAEDLILRGLRDPEPEVREWFARGSVAVSPASIRVRRVLESMRDDSLAAASALSHFEEGLSLPKTHPDRDH